MALPAAFQAIPRAGEPAILPGAPACSWLIHERSPRSPEEDSFERRPVVAGDDDWSNGQLSLEFHIITSRPHAPLLRQGKSRAPLCHKLPSLKLSALLVDATLLPTPCQANKQHNSPTRLSNHDCWGENSALCCPRSDTEVPGIRIATVTSEQTAFQCLLPH